MERLGNEYDAAITYGQLGLLAQQRGQRDEAMDWMIRAGQRFAKWNDVHSLGTAMLSYVRIARGKIVPMDRPKLAGRWLEAGLPAIPEQVFETVESEGV